MHPDGKARLPHPRIPPDLLARAVTRRSAVLRERVDEVTAEVLPALVGGGVRAILLKGPATVGWLYDGEHARHYADTDILVSPDDLDRSGVTLRRLGFECAFDERDYVANPHAQMWSRSDSPEVDLHWQLRGIGVAPGEAWRILSSETERLNVSGVDIEMLGVPARALHLALHAAYHQRASAYARTDLERALARLDMGVWVEAVALARLLRAEAAVGAGLRQAPDGVALAEELGVTRAGEDYWALAGGLAVPGAHGVHRVLSTGSKFGAARVLARELFPPVSYMRLVSPSANFGPAALVAAYVNRLFRGARSAPAAITTASRTKRVERQRSKGPWT